MATGASHSCWPTKTSTASNYEDYHCRKTLSSILNGRSGISAEMAVRLLIAFATTAESWLKQQMQYDLWQAERNRKKLRVKRLSAA